MNKIKWLIFFTIIIAISFLISKISGFYKGISDNSQNNKKILEEKSEYNILFLGYGGFNEDGTPHDGTYLTDTIINVNINTKLKKVTLISIPRDLWVKVPTESGEDFHLKINSIYQNQLFPDTFPDIKANDQLLQNTIKQVTGLNIDSYFTVDFYGFKKFIDILGGIDVKVEKTFDDTQYPIDGKEKDLCGKTEEEFKEVEKDLEATDSPELIMPCRYEHIHFDKGIVHMDGVSALKYARSRHSLQDGGDFSRSERQQKVIEAIKEKILSISFIPKIVPLLDEMQKHIKTNISSDEIAKLTSEAYKAKDYKIEKIIISDQNYLKDGYSENGQWILIPKTGKDNFSEIKNYINNNLLNITPTPTLTASQSAKLKK